jgi:hypothetical protein
MAKITDKPLLDACANGDGTYNGVKLFQWLTEAVSGRDLGEEEIRKILAEAQARAAAKKAGAE